MTVYIPGSWKVGMQGGRGGAEGNVICDMGGSSDDSDNTRGSRVVVAVIQAMGVMVVCGV